jgi:hypothetical protein
MSILNSNDYKRGFNDGYQDGFDGRDKRFFKSGLSLKFAIHGSKAIDTYNQGYNAGYEKGSYDRLSKEKPQTIKIETPKQETNKTSFSNFNNNSNSINMSVHKYYVQRDKLVELTQFLNAFKEEINQKMMEYKQRVEYLYESGLPEETRNKFNNLHIAETQQMVNTINQIIEDKSIPFTNQNIELVENLIALNS